jgi:hypothetical protein
MFKRVFVEDWALYIPFVSFFIFATVFLFVSIRALRLGKAERTRLASLPLEDHPENPHSSNS